MVTCGLHSLWLQDAMLAEISDLDAQRAAAVEAAAAAGADVATARAEEAAAVGEAAAARADATMARAEAAAAVEEAAAAAAAGAVVRAVVGLEAMGSRHKGCARRPRLGGRSDLRCSANGPRHGRTRRG